MEETLARFAGRTHHHADFDVADLAERKARAGTTLSVVIPARNEEATVGQVAGTLRRLLIDDVALVDEILVVDGDSTDATAECARAAGVRVLHQDEILPDAGSACGKGEALWKGLAAATGDLVAFVDADIQDIDARFVVGLVGPLLTDPGVAFVKATYDRPLRMGDELRPSGGGRVTELMARPLLATFWPELGWLAQPLSGEYAGRRALLESLPFVRGYGIELAMLVDIADRHGVDVIAQVDLDVRVHENQPLDALGRMSTEILQVAMQRLSAQGRMVLTEAPGQLLAQPFRDADGALSLAHVEISPSERPPLAEWLAGR
jgi:glucosyl-3-phosphoglycerate synthase